MKPDHAADVVAIADVIQRVAMAFDRKRHEEMLPRLFTADARIVYRLSGSVMDFSMPGGIPVFKEFHDRCRWTQHLVAPPVVDLAGDEARAFSQVRATHVQVREDGTENVWTVWASYHDHLVRTPDGWRIAERRVPCEHETGAFEQDGVRLFPGTAPLP